eukprot:scaffold347_cov239-Pinguiococcus_pyrenoidosus.AAC.47
MWQRSVSMDANPAFAALSKNCCPTCDGLCSHIDPQILRECQRAEGQASPQHGKEQHRAPAVRVAQSPKVRTKVERQQAFERVR